MTDYYQLELDDLVIALNNKDTDIKLLQKKLNIATKALREYTIDNWVYEDEYNNYSLGSGGWCHAEEALKEIESVGKSAKEEV